MPRGVTARGEMSGFVKEEESAARQVEEGEAREGQADQGQEPEGADVGPLDPETLKEEAVRWQERAEELTQQLLRLQADFDNYRKRSRRDLQEGLSEPTKSWFDSSCQCWIIWKGHWPQIVMPVKIPSVKASS